MGWVQAWGSEGRGAMLGGVEGKGWGVRRGVSEVGGCRLW